jgi:endonuclease-3
MSRTQRRHSDRGAHAREVTQALARAYPDATCALVHSDPYQLLVATILSAQCTDTRVNMVTPELFRRFPDAVSLAQAPPEELEELIRSTGFFRAKARNLLAMAKHLVDLHDGSIPSELEALTALPGVGRKTANVVLGTAFEIASGVVVDTHVQRLARRLGLSKGRTPEQIEKDLMRDIPRSGWVDLGHRLIQHGRRVCLARRPRCDICSLAEICPKIGVKEVRKPGASAATGRPRKPPPKRTRKTVG